MPVAHPNGETLEFPMNKWGSGYLRAARTPLPQERRLVDLDAIKLSDLTREGECAELAAMADRRKEHSRAQAIFEQAVSPLGMIQPLLEVASLNPFQPPHPQLIEWTDVVFDHLNAVVFRLKLHFNRPRPYHNCSESTVLAGIPRPPHASYPSGHATVAYTFAGLIGHARPAQANALMESAADVAVNREIAGVHFPSDSAAGKELARVLVDGMLNSSASPAGRFRELMQALV